MNFLKKIFNFHRPIKNGLLDYKKNAIDLLKGNGLEIGALHNKFLKDDSNDILHIEYLDVVDSFEAGKNFKEIDPSSIKSPKYVADASKVSVKEITGNEYDFIICNHVIEHVANPVRFLDSLFSGIKRGGLLVLSAPDKDYTFDKKRTSSSYNSLLAAYYLEKDSSCDARYIDFLEGVHPEVFENKERFLEAFVHVKSRFEHVFVWRSDEFREQLLMILKLLNISYSIELESLGSDNKYEYFVVIKKI